MGVSAFRDRPVRPLRHFSCAIREGRGRSLAHPRSGCGDEKSPVNRYGADAKAHRVRGRPEMRVLGLAFAVLLSGTASIVAHANGMRSNMAPANAGPAPDIVLAWDGRGSGGHPAAFRGGRTP